MAYKLFYFNAKALAEPIRFLLSYGKIEFEDNRFSSMEEFQKVKHTMPMGQVPVLECDGKQMTQSLAICRFLAKKVGLAGKTDMENYEIDNVVDIISDLRQRLSAVHYYEKDEKVKVEKQKILQEETLPFYLSKLDGMAKDNKGHLACSKLTWADLYFTAMKEYMSLMAKFDIVEKHANLKKVTENVLAIESIKNWVKKRPVTEA